MAGIFGFFDHEKEGPGIEKDAPKKKSFIEFFELYFKNFWKLLINGIWYLLLSIPLITSGLAAAGFTNVTRNMAVDSHSFGTSDFFDTIRKNWKQALPAGIINVLIMFLLIGDLYFFYSFTTDIIMVVGIAVCLTVLVLFLMMQYYFWMILITFKLNLKQIYVNSFKFALIGLKNNLIIMISLLIFYGACYGLLCIGYNVTFFLALFLLLCILPGFRFLLIQYNVFGNVKKHMIIPYYEKHPDDDIELRRRLGVYDITEAPNMVIEIEQDSE